MNTGNSAKEVIREELIKGKDTRQVPYAENSCELAKKEYT